MAFKAKGAKGIKKQKPTETSKVEDSQEANARFNDKLLKNKDFQNLISVKPKNDQQKIISNLPAILNQIKEGRKVNIDFYPPMNKGKNEELNGFLNENYDIIQNISIKEQKLLIFDLADKEAEATASGNLEKAAEYAQMAKIYLENLSKMGVDYYGEYNRIKKEALNQYLSQRISESGAQQVLDDIVQMTLNMVQNLKELTKSENSSEEEEDEERYIERGLELMGYSSEETGKMMEMDGNKLEDFIKHKANNLILENSDLTKVIPVKNNKKHA
ncbi:hypothetical protein JXB01_01865 [Candidatus Micrarchaeota archaeon]|nr:hypothetical protein [Candidatus Micrarchaeota archaeon]